MRRRLGSALAASAMAALAVVAVAPAAYAADEYGDIVRDTFNRPAAPGWGTPTFGPTWKIIGNGSVPASSLSTTGISARAANLPAAGFVGAVAPVDRRSSLNTVNMRVRVVSDDRVSIGPLAHAADDGSAYYQARVLVQPGTFPRASIMKKTATTSETEVAAVTIPSSGTRKATATSSLYSIDLLVQNDRNGDPSITVQVSDITDPDNPVNLAVDWKDTSSTPLLRGKVGVGIRASTAASAAEVRWGPYTAYGDLCTYNDKGFCDPNLYLQ